MPNNGRAAPQLRTQGEYALRLTRVGRGCTVIVRCLSHHIDGLLVHYLHKRSQWCPGEGRCSPANHRVQTQWRGYLAAHEWDQATRLYMPTVLEITEFAEVEMRHRYQRGQTWRFTRQLDIDDVPQPVVPDLLADADQVELPAPFDLLPVLVNVYHRPDVRLGVRNPMPARVIVRPIPGEPPQCEARPTSAPTKMSAAEHEQLERVKAKLWKEGAKNGT